MTLNERARLQTCSWPAMDMHTRSQCRRVGAPFASLSGPFVQKSEGPNPLASAKGWPTSEHRRPSQRRGQGGSSIKSPDKKARCLFPLPSFPLWQRSVGWGLPRVVGVMQLGLLGGTHFVCFIN